MRYRPTPIQHCGGNVSVCLITGQTVKSLHTENDYKIKVVTGPDVVQLIN